MYCYLDNALSNLTTRDEVGGNIRTRGKTKLTSFPRDHTLSVLLYISTFPQAIVLLYSARVQQLRNCIPVGIHLNLIKEHVTKNQPITVLILLNESVAIKQYILNPEPGG